MTHKYLDENFDLFSFFKENDNKLVHLRNDAEAMLGDSASIVTASGVMAAAILLGKWRIVRDDLPLETPLEIETERRYKLFSVALGRYLACEDLESKGILKKNSIGWEKTSESETMTIEDLIQIEQFGEL